MLRQREAVAAMVVGNKPDLDCEQREHLDSKKVKRAHKNRKSLNLTPLETATSSAKANESSRKQLVGLPDPSSE